MTSLLRRRPHYRNLWLADLVSNTGDWFSVVAVCALSAQGSPSAARGALSLAAVLAAHLVPQALLAPIAGWLADRLDRRSVLLATSLLEGALTLAMTLAAMKQAVPLVQLLLLLRSSVSALREPAVGAALPRLVEPGELASANAFGAVTWSVSFVAGMAVGGFVAEAGPTLALAVDAASFLVAALLVARLPSLPPRTEVEPAALRHTLLVDARETAHALRDPELFLVTFAKAPVGVAAGAAWMALNLLARDHAFLGAAATLGLLQAVRGAGTGIGPIVARVLASRARPDTLLHGAALAVAVGAMGLALSPSAPVAFVSVLLWGMGGGAAWVLTTTRLQLKSEPSMRGRLVAVDTMGLALGMSGGAFVTALLVDAGISIAHAAMALVVVAAFGWLWATRSRTSATLRSPAA